MITTTSARLAIHQATAFGWEKREGVGGARPGSAPLVAHGISCGAVLAAVERNPAPVRDWLIVAYAAPGYPGVARAAREAHEALLAGSRRARVRRAKHGRMERLGWAVLDDYRRCQIGGEAAGLAWYSVRVGFRLANAAPWCRARDAMIRLLDEWDRRGLAEVGAVLHREVA